MKTLASLMILSFCLVFPLAAQTDKNVEDEIPRSVNEATMIGIGGYNVMDTYLTPGIETKYTGWGVRIQNERMKIVRLADYKVSRQQFLNVEFASTRTWQPIMWVLWTIRLDITTDLPTCCRI